MTAGDENEFVVWRKLHDLAWCQQRARSFLAGYHQMAEPGTQAMAGIVLGIAYLGRRTEGIGDALGRTFVIRGEAHPYMAVIEDRIVDAIGFLDLVQRLCDQEALQSVPCHEGECAFEEVEPPDPPSAGARSDSGSGEPAAWFG